MKQTAMQEFIEWVDTIIAMLPDESLGAKSQMIIAKLKAESMLKEEKELMMTFNQLKVGDRVKTKHSGMATVLQVGAYKGTMVKLKCDKPRWGCPYFYESELELDTEEDGKIYKRISDLPQFINPTETDKLMNIYIGQQAKSLFYMREVPVESIGVFQCIGGDWVYWFNNGFTYDTGVADSEAEALQIAKKNFKPYNYDII